jgi:hypothetical protein
MQMGRMFLCVTAVAGCTTRIGSAPLLAREVDLVATKLLRPGVIGRSCGATILGIPVGGSEGTLNEALARVLAQDIEGNVVTEAVILEERITTGLVNWRCLIMRGDLGRSITTITVPAERYPGPGTH